MSHALAGMIVIQSNLIDVTSRPASHLAGTTRYYNPALESILYMVILQMIVDVEGTMVH